MKKESFLKILYLLTAAVVIFNLVYIVRDSLFFDLDDLPKGEKLYTLTSPGGENELNVYSVENSLGSAIRAEVTENGSSRNIYWQTDQKSADCSWIDDNVVEINDVRIDFEHGGTYDCRRGYSIFQEGSLEGQAAPDVKAKAR